MLKSGTLVKTDEVGQLTVDGRLVPGKTTVFWWNDGYRGYPVEQDHPRLGHYITCFYFPEEARKVKLGSDLESMSLRKLVTWAQDRRTMVRLVG